MRSMSDASGKRERWGMRRLVGWWLIHWLNYLTLVPPMPSMRKLSPWLGENWRILIKLRPGVTPREKLTAHNIPLPVPPIMNLVCACGECRTRLLLRRGFEPNWHSQAWGDGLKWHLWVVRCCEITTPCHARAISISLTKWTYIDVHCGKLLKFTPKYVYIVWKNVSYWHFIKKRNIMKIRKEVKPNAIIPR